MNKNILLIQGHPDVSQHHFCHALEKAYAEGAMATGHKVQHVNAAALDFPILRSQQEWEHGTLPMGLGRAQAAIRWANHIVLPFPLWLGDMRALLKGFLEQVTRPGFAFSSEAGNPFAHKGLVGRSARVVFTMGSQPQCIVDIFAPTACAPWNAIFWALSASLQSTKR